MAHYSMLWQRFKLSAARLLDASSSKSSTSRGLAALQEHLAVFGWSAAIVASRWSRLLAKDPMLPPVCNSCPWLFNRGRLPEGASFQFFRRYLPQACTCVGPVGCKFPRYPPSSGPGNRQHRLEFGRIGVDLGRGRGRDGGGGRVSGHTASYESRMELARQRRMELAVIEQNNDSPLPLC